jgi:hypothetical protein
MFSHISIIKLIVFNFKVNNNASMVLLLINSFCLIIMKFNTIQLFILINYFSYLNIVFLFYFIKVYVELIFFENTALLTPFFFIFWNAGISCLGQNKKIKKLIIWNEFILVKIM